MSCDEKLAEDKELQALKSLYNISIEIRNFEINQLIQRNNFFMLFQGVLLASALQTQASKPFVEIIICFAGVMVSIYQLQMASGAKFWQEWWESRVEHFEKLLSDKTGSEGRYFHELFDVSRDKVHETIKKRLSAHRGWSLSNALILGVFSVGRAPIKVSIVLIISWVLLLIHTLDISNIADLPNFVKGFYFTPTK